MLLPATKYRILLLILVAGYIALHRGRPCRRWLHPAEAGRPETRLIPPPAPSRNGRNSSVGLSAETVKPPYDTRRIAETRCLWVICAVPSRAVGALGPDSTQSIVAPAVFVRAYDRSRRFATTAQTTGRRGRHWPSPIILAKSGQFLYRRRTSNDILREQRTHSYSDRALRSSQRPPPVGRDTVHSIPRENQYPEGVCACAELADGNLTMPGLRVNTTTNASIHRRFLFFDVWAPVTIGFTNTWRIAAYFSHGLPQYSLRIVSHRLNGRLRSGNPSYMHHRRNGPILCTV